MASGLLVTVLGLFLAGGEFLGLADVNGSGSGVADDLIVALGFVVVLAELLAAALGLLVAVAGRFLWIREGESPRSADVG